jgi:F-type H+-transporting ATPase subunit delta
MKVTKQARREAKQLFRACQVNGLLDENRVRQAVDQILATRPRGYLAVLSHFQRLLKLDAARRLARIESAAPLSPGLQSAIKSNLERIYGPGLNFQFSQQPTLLGGVRVQVGSDVYDGTVRARLKEVEEAFESA